MGHVIEENNGHARLGCGAGHFFRALWGQDLGGIDIVLHGLIPGIKGGSHTSSVGLEADTDFFYYSLAQLTTSVAHLDPKKRGRSMCEIFGAFGWQEGVREMKWLADFMLSRGVNYYVPHAFTGKAFPDPDCPPHFYGHGHNPQYRYFGKLMQYMNRVSTLIDGGRHLSEVAVLYHAEAEWAGNDYMKMQVPMEVLTQNQIEADIISIDLLEEAACTNGVFSVNNMTYGMLVVPYTKYIPAHLVKSLAALCAKNVPVIFVDALPEASSTDPIDVEGKLSQMGCEVVPLCDLAKVAAAIVAPRVQTDSFEPDLKIYPYENEGNLYVLLFNEGIQNPIETTLFVDDERTPYFYDAMTNRAIAADVQPGEYGVNVALRLEPWEMLVLAFEEGELPELCQPMPVNTVPFMNLDGLTWKVGLAESIDYPNFTPTDVVSGPANLLDRDKLPRFSGIIRYETAFTLDEVPETCILDLGVVGEVAHVYVNGVDAGYKWQSPLRFDVGALLKAGENALLIEVTNTLGYSQRDRGSSFLPLAPSGLVGPVNLEK